MSGFASTTSVKPEKTRDQGAQMPPLLPTKRAMKLNVLMLGKCKEKSSSYGWAKPNQIFWPSAKAHGHTKVIYWINPLHGGITREAVVRAVEMRLPLGPEPGAPSVGWFGWELAR